MPGYVFVGSDHGFPLYDLRQQAGVLGWVQFGGVIGVRFVERMNRATLQEAAARYANGLIDLAQRETMNRSAGFAGGVVDEVGREQTLLGNTHRFAGFAVLKAPEAFVNVVYTFSA